MYAKIAYGFWKKRYVRYLVKKVKETCILIDKAKREKIQKQSVHPRNIAAVAKSVREALSTSIHYRSQQLNISETSLRWILHKDLGITAYKVQLIQELKSIDHRMRFGFDKWACNRLIEDVDFGKKVMFSDEAHFDLGGECKPAKLSHLGHRKPERIHWKADALKTSHCLVRLLVQRHNWISLKIGKGRSLQSMAIVIGPCRTNFYSQKLKRRILATVGFNSTALRATQPKLHLIFCGLFLKIALSAAELMSFGHLRAEIWHRWNIICGLPSKISATPTSQKQLTL